MAFKKGSSNEKKKYIACRLYNERIVIKIFKRIAVIFQIV